MNAASRPQGLPTPPNAQATFAATLVDEWVRCGLEHAVVCPGSRSTPLVLALAQRSELALHVRLDERGACFYALGLAAITGRPVVVCTTSGTAAAELLPGVVEAASSRLPLILCTADRPPALHGVGAPQSIEQTGLFGCFVSWSMTPGVPEDSGRGWWRSLAARAYAEASDGPGGPSPVHLNLSFVEPLVGGAGDLPPARPDHRPWHRFARLVEGDAPAALEELVSTWRGRDGVVIAGAHCGPADAVFDFADALGWPVLADPRSGCRVSREGVVSTADVVLRAPAVKAALEPEVIVSLGEPWISKVVAGFVAESAGRGAAVVLVDRWGRWLDPDRVASARFHADPESWLRAALRVLAADPPGPAPAGGPGEAGKAEPSRSWRARWIAAEEAARQVVEAVLVDAGGRPQRLEAERRSPLVPPARHQSRLSEPGVAARILGMLPPGAALLVSASMPVRDLEWFAPPLPHPPRVFSNRGANGIDGVVATAQGMAAAGVGPVVALVGDLAFFHDASSLVTLASTRPASTSCTIVVLDNGGGGIFEFLPQARVLDRTVFETFFATPPAVSVVEVARGFGIPAVEVRSAHELDAALATLVGTEPLAVVLVAVPSRSENLVLHEELSAAVAEAVTAALEGDGRL